jgi:hypothetical protein
VTELADLTEGQEAPQPLTPDERAHVLGTDTSSLSYADRPDWDVAVSCADSPAAGAGMSSMKRDHAFDMQKTRSHIGDHDVVLGTGLSVHLFTRESALRCTCGQHFNNARK